MKCPYCGGEVALEDLLCPYCGQPNEQSVRHREDMERYRAHYDRTVQSVAAKTKAYVHVVPRVVVLLVLLLSTVVMAVIGMNAYEIRDAARQRAAMRDTAATKAVLDNYLEQGDYKGFVSYSEFHNIRFYNSEFSDYREVDACAYEYTMFLLRLERLFLNRDQETWARMSASGDFRILSSTIVDLFDSLDYYGQQELSEQNRFYLQDIRQNAEGMLRVFLGIDEAGLEEFLAMSENRQVVYLEEVFLDA